MDLNNKNTTRTSADDLNDDINNTIKAARAEKVGGDGGGIGPGDAKPILPPMPDLNWRNYTGSIFIGLIVVIIGILFSIAGIITDYYWFDVLGFKDIFMISLTAKLLLFAIGTFIAGAFIITNLLIHKGKIPIKVKITVASIVAVFMGFYAASKWFIFKQFFNQVVFGIVDPIFMRDAAFYVFSLPFYLAVWKFIFTLLIITTVIILLDKLLSLRVSTKDFAAQIRDKHLGILLALIFIALAVKHYLARFSIMYSEQGIVVGAGYSDVVVFLPMLKLLMISAIIVAIVFIIWITVKQKTIRKRHIILYAVILYVIVGFLGPNIIPGLVQAFKVSPNEINLESPYIKNNIEFTKIAYGLDNVEEQNFTLADDLTSDILEQESQTIDNVRILDWRPLTTTYKQTQEIRLYYDLSEIDIDRYTINDKYTQVLLSARELDQDQITDNAKTWVNLKQVYTHGFGAVMSPVNEVTKEGLPNYLIKDIPPVTAVAELKIENPRIYYGEKNNGYVVANTGTQEFDYPKGDTNEYISYDGKGGVVLDSFMKKLLMAIRFGDIKILLSSDIRPDSKLLMMRNIQDRIKKLTPFFVLDSDPYLVIDKGRMLWIQDAYTVTGNFPYSAKQNGINYIRNSVKIFIDAYDGTVTYYVMDPKDSLIATYANIFPGQFMLAKDLPASLKKHIRYPEELFKIQSSIYSTYHMENVKVFYNKEDAWQIPYEIYGTGQKVQMEPYYMIMKLPGENKEEFVLMSPFTPIKKDNMIAWMAARSDNDEYGKLVLYKFPKDKLIYGPLQIEAKIDQDSEISQQLTLWSQQGSQVTRGNLLVIPIQNSILYIEPLYIQAEKGQLPELKRVLASDGERVVMEKDLKTALRALFGKATVNTNETGYAVEDQTYTELVEEADVYYANIEQAMKEGDWSAIGENFDKLGKIIEALKE